MLLSMTGFGEARRQGDSLTVNVEVRTINNRYFKLSLKCSEGYSLLETQIESTVRQQVKRGSVQLNLRIVRPETAESFRLNMNALASYREQLEALHVRWHLSDPVNLENLLGLPGVVENHHVDTSEVQKDWAIIEPVLVEALQQLDAMRKVEGQQMADDLLANCQTISNELDLVQQRAPHVVEGYRTRLHDRLQPILAEYQVTLSPGDIIREICLFTERSDISEEIVRLRGHLDQFRRHVASDESSGRKLDFVTQEMFREANTIGSKSNDQEISQHTVEIKAAIERIREMIQNVE